MTEVVKDADLRRLVSVIDACRPADAGEGLPVAALDRAFELVSCDAVTFQETIPAAEHVSVLQASPAPDDDEEDDAEGFRPFWHHFWESDCSYPERTGDLISITITSDFYTARELHNTGMYTDYLGPAGIEGDAVLSLSAPPGVSRRLIFFRGPGPDFDGRDRLLLALLRPHLNEAYQELQRRRRPVPTLTSRQWELLRLVADGRTNSEIARDLFVSTYTIRKHLENIFARLEVTNRTAAIAKAFPTPPY